MPVDPNSLAAGKCYLNGNQVRRIHEITADDTVRYEARSAAQPDKWGIGGSPSRQRFADDVDREVSCKYDSRYDADKS